MKILKQLAKTVLCNDIILIIFCALVFFGISFQYSAAKSWSPWAMSHLIKALCFLPILFMIQFIKPNFLMSVAYPLFALNLLLLVIVNMFGHVGMGAQRWIDLYVVKLQPSEMIKVSVVLMLARYYSGVPYEKLSNLTTHLLPVLLVSLPCTLIAVQPDLGTAGIIFIIVIFMIFVTGLNFRHILLFSIAAMSTFPYVWSRLYTYQKQRILTFLNPESDPLGSGYHVIQSKIAIGSAGIYGKGFYNGTQSRLNFLPEKHTDFIFATLSEETGFIGSLFIIVLFAILIYYIVKISLSSTSSFHSIMGLGISFLFFLHVFINVSMVLGILPVVGVPLPFVSYGGSSLLTFTVLLGLVIHISMSKK